MAALREGGTHAREAPFVWLGLFLDKLAALTSNQLNLE